MGIRKHGQKKRLRRTPQTRWATMGKKLAKVGLLKPTRESDRYARPTNHWRLASWFSDFVNAPDLASIRPFRDEAIALALTVPGPTEPAESVLVRAKARLTRRNKALAEPPFAVTDDDLIRTQLDARESINWFLERLAEKNESGKTNEEDGGNRNQVIKPLSISPVRGEELLQWSGTKVERTFLPEDFRGKILSRLFALIAAKACPFGRCQQCHKIFATRGPQLYCTRRCLVRSRPPQRQREYQRKYMRDLRKTEFMARLQTQNPALWKQVEGRGKTIQQARRELRRSD